jgi:hypothetical protein
VLRLIRLCPEKNTLAEVGRRGPVLGLLDGSGFELFSGSGFELFSESPIE